ncbi:hypothetical protein [Acidihalobacter ferrooxydans]|uniref:Zinc finger CHC2-type domain-containing protein n=1 Tax=Acidihalobacter ferrooxydans TaxID=1765967 RepID=A0A1P8UJ29_9GAMM|nr:hypothetical protein [Acidihalobacter ferrooxydans]APZ43846.1 hypothetical protein BW247_12715 [Acidihalobacter ferrooxydans]
MTAPIDRVLPLLDGVRQTGPNRWIARCPAHADKSPSLSIREAEDGRLLVYCFGGCEAEDVTAALGLRMADLFPERPQYRPGDRAQEPRISLTDLVDLLAHEALIAYVAAADAAHGKPISNEDADRAALAAQRIRTAVDYARGYPR